MMLVLGALHLLAPLMIMAPPATVLISANHLHIIRAACGGAFPGIAALLLSGPLQPAQRGLALLGVAMLFGGFAPGRLGSLALAGVPMALFPPSR